MSTPQVKPIRPRRKAHEITDQLTSLALNLGPEAKLPTVVQLCKLLQVSPTTLNTVLHDLESKGLIQRRHGVGIFVSHDMRQKTKQQICLLCDAAFFHGSGNSPFWDVLLKEAREQVTSHKDFSLHFVESSHDKRPPLTDELLESLRAGRVHGLLGVGLLHKTTRWLVEECAPHVPLVCFAGPAPWHVELDVPRLIEMGVQELATRGCRKIGLWLPTTPYLNMKATKELTAQHVDSFCRALKASNLKYDARLVQSEAMFGANEEIVPTVSHQRQGYKAATTVFRRRNFCPDGVVILDDMMTWGALVALRHLGIEAGRDVQIATHANKGVPTLMGHENEICAIEFDLAECAQTMFALLDMLMHGETPEQSTTLIAPRVVNTSETLFPHTK